MPPGVIVSDHGVPNPACTPGVVFSGTIMGTPTAQGTFTSVLLQGDGVTALATFIWTITNTPRSTPSTRRHSRRASPSR
jgi:hypothetical protein